MMVGFFLSLMMNGYQVLDHLEEDDDYGNLTSQVVDLPLPDDDDNDDNLTRWWTYLMLITQVVDLPDEKLQALHKEAKVLYDSYIKVSDHHHHHYQYITITDY